MREIKIDFDNPGLPQRLDVVENDAQSRFFKAVLYKDGKAYATPSGATYSIMYQGFGPQNEGWYDTINDGAGKRAACSVSGNVVTCEIARQALRVPGHVSVVLCVTDSNGYMLHGWPIDCNCRNDNYTGGTSVESFFYITQVTNADWTSAIQTWEELKNMIDPTLSLSGKAADAKATGGKLQMRSGGWLTHPEAMVKFNTLNNTVTVDGWYVGNSLVNLKVPVTLTYDTSKNFAYIILDPTTARPIISYSPPTVESTTLFIFLTNPKCLSSFTACSLPISAYLVDGNTYLTAYNRGYMSLPGKLVNFNTIDNTVTIDGWSVSNKLTLIGPAKTISYDTRNAKAYVIRNNDGSITVQYNEPTNNQFVLFIFFTNPKILKSFNGCSLPVNGYTVDGAGFVGAQYRSWITQPDSLVEFDTNVNTVHVNGWSVTNKLSNSYNLTLTYDTSYVKAYVVVGADELPTIIYTEPTGNTTTLFIFFTRPWLLQGFTGCSLPVNTYTVNGKKYSDSFSTIKVNLTADISDTISYDGQTIEIDGKSHAIDFGEHFNVSGSGVFNVNYTADSSGEVYAVFVSKTKPLITQARHPWPTVCLWAITDSKSIRLTPYATTSEVATNENSFTYESGHFVINCNNVIEIVKCPDGTHTYGIKLNNCNGTIKNLTIKYATNNSVYVKDSSININNCTFMYSKSASLVYYIDSSGTIENCCAYYANYDGFGFAKISKATSGGGTTIINCTSAHNFDDGFSHHQNNTTFNFIGCTAFDCGKSGIASPTYSSNGSIHDCYLHDNLYGIYASDSDEYPANNADVLIYNSIITNNQCGIRTDGYQIKLFNCKKANNATADVTTRNGSITEL